MANWLYNLLHGKLPGQGFLGRSSTGSGAAELLSPSQATALLPAATASNDGKMTAAQAGHLKLTKKITFTTASTQGGISYVAHGVTRSKIQSCNVFVSPQTPANAEVPPGYNYPANIEYYIILQDDEVRVINKANNSGLILSRPGRIFIVYEE